MIDIEKDVYAAVKDAVAARYTGVDVTDHFLRVPETFPHICISECENITYKRTRDGVNVENHAIVAYQVDVYVKQSPTRAVRKAYARSLLDCVDTCMLGLGFGRDLFQVTANMDDATIYRILARYSGVTDGKFIYADK